jgi:TonB family protein
MAFHLRRKGHHHSPEWMGRMFRRNWPAMSLFLLPAMVCATTTSPNRPIVQSLDHRERVMVRTLTRAAQYVDVPHISSRPECEDVHPPQALTTPDPLMASAVDGRKVRVSFIIGTDGHVHSPLILESGGLAGDRRVLQTVRTWRYRPATCNGVPTETEGKIEFSSR